MIKFGKVEGENPEVLKESGVEITSEVRRRGLDATNVIEVRGQMPLSPKKPVTRKSIGEGAQVINTGKSKHYAKKSQYLTDILGD